jgi:hypothetical protein
MGEVYEVELELTGKRHALKLLSAEVMEVSGSLERFQQEAKVMARLEHPRIVRVDLTDEDGGRHWLRMEMMPGREVQGKRVITLEEYLEAKGIARVRGEEAYGGNPRSPGLPPQYPPGPLVAMRSEDFVSRWARAGHALIKKRTLAYGIAGTFLKTGE